MKKNHLFMKDIVDSPRVVRKSNYFHLLGSPLQQLSRVQCRKKRGWEENYFSLTLWHCEILSPLNSRPNKNSRYLVPYDIMPFICWNVGPDTTVLKKIRRFPDGSKGSWLRYLKHLSVLLYLDFSP